MWIEKVISKVSFFFFFFLVLKVYDLQLKQSTSSHQVLAGIETGQIQCREKQLFCICHFSLVLILRLSHFSSSYFKQLIFLICLFLSLIFLISFLYSSIFTSFLFICCLSFFLCGYFLLVVIIFFLIPLLYTMERRWGGTRRGSPALYNRYSWSVQLDLDLIYSQTGLPLQWALEENRYSNWRNVPVYVFP